MVGILRSVLMGLHRLAPPSDKAELDASAAGSQEVSMVLPLAPDIQCVFEHLYREESYT
jgi:hypothetical protein